jgi:hypothetical protein
MCREYKCKRKGKAVLVLKNQPIRHVGEMATSLQAFLCFNKERGLPTHLMESRFMGLKTDLDMVKKSF